MTLKQKLLKDYEMEKDIAVSITLYISMPTGEIETITNPKVKEKIAYIDKTYNDELVHANCDKIKIVNYSFETTCDTMNFGEAIEALKAGKKVARKGWNGKGMFLLLTASIDFETKADLSSCRHLEGELTLPSIVMKTADDKFVVGWLASQTDMLADDWCIVE